MMDPASAIKKLQEIGFYKVFGNTTILYSIFQTDLPLGQIRVFVWPHKFKVFIIIPRYRPINEIVQPQEFSKAEKMFTYIYTAMCEGVLTQ